MPADISYADKKSDWKTSDLVTLYTSPLWLKDKPYSYIEAPRAHLFIHSVDGNHYVDQFDSYLQKMLLTPGKHQLKLVCFWVWDDYKKLITVVSHSVDVEPSQQLYLIPNAASNDCQPIHAEVVDSENS